MTTNAPVTVSADAVALEIETAWSVVAPRPVTDSKVEVSVTVSAVLVPVIEISVPATKLNTPVLLTVNAAVGPPVVTEEKLIPGPAVGVTDVMTLCPESVMAPVLVTVANTMSAVVSTLCGSEIMPLSSTLM